MKVFLVVPTIRSLLFLNSWGGQLSDCHLLIIEDHPAPRIEDPKSSFRSISHFSWQDIARDFGENEWIFSRQNAGIRSYGFWKAYQLGADVIITLDDDCFPVDNNFVNQHINNLRAKAPDYWFPTFPHPTYIYTRGIPYGIRDKHPAVISHGLWTNNIDLDGITEAKHKAVNVPAYPPLRVFIPKDMYFPMCSMNLAFKREATPFMYFPLMGFDPKGSPWGYDRFDDIWAGIFAKKICDHLGLAVVSGSPFVEHRKASNIRKNIAKEKSGIEINEYLWQSVDKVRLAQDTPAACYRELAQKIQFPKQVYFQKLRTAMIIWSELFR